MESFPSARFPVTTTLPETLEMVADAAGAPAVPEFVENVSSVGLLACSVMVEPLRETDIAFAFASPVRVNVFVDVL